MQVINQESAWDTPPSPQPGTKEPPPVAPCPPGVVPGAPQWKANTGTEIWESSVRSSRGGPKQPPPAPTSQVSTLAGRRPVPVGGRGLLTVAVEEPLKNRACTRKRLTRGQGETLVLRLLSYFLAKPNGTARACLDF